MQGLDEVAVATVMKYVLLGLEYVHKNGGIHRDVKVRCRTAAYPATPAAAVAGAAAAAQAAAVEAAWIV